MACDRPFFPPFSPRDCAGAPGIIGIIPKRSSPDCVTLLDPPPAVLTSAGILAVPPIAAPPAFGCVMPAGQVILASAEGGVTEMVIEPERTEGAVDDCDVNVLMKATFPDFMIDPITNPPCGTFESTTLISLSSTEPISFVPEVTQLDADAYGCNRNLDMQLTLPSLLLDMVGWNNWPDFLAQFLSQIPPAEWEVILQDTDLGGGGGGGLVVKITGHVSGKVYHVSIYENGPDRDPTATSVEAEQLQIDDSIEIIPADTWAIATRIKRGTLSDPGPPAVYDGPEEEKIYFQVPIWLPPGAAPTV